MKKPYINEIVCIVLFLLAGVLIWQKNTDSNQAMAALAFETDFVGEYSQNGSDWKELTKNTKVSAYDGDLLLRGKFSETVPMYYNFYLNHIGMTISVNGEDVFTSGRCSDGRRCRFFAG